MTNESGGHEYCHKPVLALYPVVFNVDQEIMASAKVGNDIDCFIVNAEPHATGDNCT